MRRFLVLWLVFAGIDAVTGLAITVGIARNIDARFEPLAAWALAAPVQALALLAAIPSLRGRPMTPLSAALSTRGAAIVGRVALVAIAAGAVAVVVRAIPVASLVWARIWFLALATVALLLVRPRKTWPLVTASLLALVALHSAGIVPLPLAFRVPSVLRWIVGYGTAGISLVLLLLHLADRERDAHPAAAASFEWALIPALAASLVVSANIFWRPFLTPGSALVAQVLGIAAAALVAAGSVAMHSRPGR